MIVKINNIRAVALVAFGIMGLPSIALSQENQALPLEDLQAFSEVFGKIKNDYVDQIDDATLLKNAIRGMLAGLDPHSSFLDSDEYKDLRESTDGKFGGLGIEVIAEGGRVKVVAPIDGTPASEADIQAGDLIVMIDDMSLKNVSLQQAVDKMRGEPGSEIKLTIARQGQSGPIEVTLVRAIIKVQSVKGELLESGFGYVRLASFQSGTAQSLKVKINKMVQENAAPLQGLILDLRNNPGGVLPGAVQISDLFLAAGKIVSTRGRNNKTGQPDQRGQNYAACSNKLIEENAEIIGENFVACNADIIEDAPMVVLVNGGSASASEIVAGALQDHQRAIIMGTPTFGKGSVQTIIPMNNGSALKLTTARYFTPNDRSIQAKGIIPDIVTEQLDLSKLSAQRSRISEADLSGHLENAEEDKDQESEKLQQEKTRKLTDNDHQLQEALNLLKGMSLVKRRSDANAG